jgi:hypothetical protein
MWTVEAYSDAYINRTPNRKIIIFVLNIAIVVAAIVYSLNLLQIKYYSNTRDNVDHLCKRIFITFYSKMQYNALQHRTSIPRTNVFFHIILLLYKTLKYFYIKTDNHDSVL